MSNKPIVKIIWLGQEWEFELTFRKDILPATGEETYIAYPTKHVVIPLANGDVFLISRKKPIGAVVKPLDMQEEELPEELMPANTKRPQQQKQQLPQPKQQYKR